MDKRVALRLDREEYEWLERLGAMARSTKQAVLRELIGQAKQVKIVDGQMIFEFKERDRQ